MVSMDTIAKLQRKTSIHKRSSIKTDEEEFKGRAQDSEWKDSSKVNNCSLCSKTFTLTFRKHHCRECGGVFCGPCSAYKVVITGTLKRVSLLCYVKDFFLRIIYSTIQLTYMAFIL